VVLLTNNQIQGLFYLLCLFYIMLSKVSFKCFEEVFLWCLSYIMLFKDSFTPDSFGFSLRFCSHKILLDFFHVVFFL